MKLKFDSKEWEGLTRYLQEWDKWRKEKRVGRPDYTSDAIFLIPLIISLIKSSDNLKRLTWFLLILTLAILIETALLIFTK